MFTICSFQINLHHCDDSVIRFPFPGMDCTYHINPAKFHFYSFTQFTVNKSEIVIHTLQLRDLSYSLNSRIRVRYGDVWAPRHPSSSRGTLHSFTIDPDETLETMECLSGWVIHMIRINTTKGSYVVPRRYRPQRRLIYLENGMFFTGAQARYGEMCLTKLSTRTALCNP